MTWTESTVVQAFKNIQNECKNNKMLVQSNDWLTTENVEVIIKITILMTYLFNMFKGWQIYNQSIVYIKVL